MRYVLIPFVSFLAAGLTFFSGFGLGTVLMPVFALFFPLPVAVAITAVVHFLNNLFKFGLVYRHVEKEVFWRFGLPAVVAAFVGAELLIRLSGSAPLWQFEFMGRVAQGTPIKLIIALILLGLVPLEFWQWRPSGSNQRAWLYAGGALSGFFGGLSGNQGAFRSAALFKAGLSKEQFIATGVALACLVDATRLIVYGTSTLRTLEWRTHGGLIALSAGAAFAGAFLASRLLKKVTLEGIRILVAAMLIVIAMGMGIGIL